MSRERTEMLRSFVRDVPDFPKPGIVFKDLTPLLASPVAFTTCLDLFAEHYVNAEVDIIVGIESRGFIFGAALAARMLKSFVPARKPGKLPRATERVHYELEYGRDAMELHKDALPASARVLVVDDLIATGGTAWATAELIRRQRCTVVAAAFVIELSALDGRQRLRPVQSMSLLRY